MKIAIIEDEIPARKHLVASLKKIRSGVEVVIERQSIKGAIAAFADKPSLDVIFLDVQLNDGLSFEIFDYVQLDTPIIFTTAFDQYMQEAFQNNGIDYLLKPIKLADLENALGKLDRMKSHFTGVASFMRQWSQKPPLRRILVKKGIHFKSVPLNEIAYLLSEQKVTFLIDKGGNRYVVDRPLSTLEEDLDPDCFFRANRKYLVSIDSVDAFKSIGQGKLTLALIPKASEEVIVSQEKAAGFKDWIAN